MLQSFALGTIIINARAFQMNSSVALLEHFHVAKPN
jgi:hypothetical protein